MKPTFRSNERQRFAVIPAVYVYLRRGHEVLLQLRENTGHMDGMWSASAAGHIEFEETAAAAAVREAEEEIGILLTPGSLTPLTVMQRTDGTSAQIEQRADWFYVTTEWSGTLRIIETAKCAGLDWFDLHDLPAAMPPYERLVLEGVAAGALPAFTSYGFEATAGRRVPEAPEHGGNV
ncbi:MAG: NUDIX domain-containing protein [Leucobacter sp.]